MQIKTLVRGALCAGGCLAVFYGINWLIAPSQVALVAEGRDLFVHEWTVDDPLSGDGDGLGPVFNAKSCVACHFQSGVGGGGDNAHNVTAFQVLPNRNDKQHLGGVVHAFATASALQEGQDSLRLRHPVIPDSTHVTGVCFSEIESFDPLIIETINTPSLYGAGLIDQISTYAIHAHERGTFWGSMTDDFNRNFTRTPVGKSHNHSMGRAGKFGWRGQFVSLEDFVATACAVELGLTNTIRAQDTPHEHVPNYDAEYDMTNRQLKAIVEFCRSLPRPEQILPEDSVARAAVERGELMFAQVGCTDCHVQDFGGVTEIYSDFLLHSVGQLEGSDGYFRKLEVPLPSGMPQPDEWKTPPLWGVADSAPYFHDGQSATLEVAIGRHSGAARFVMQRHKVLPSGDRESILRFLESLRAPRAVEQIPESLLLTQQ